MTGPTQDAGPGGGTGARSHPVGTRRHVEDTTGVRQPAEPLTLDDALEDLRVGRILRDDGQRVARLNTPLAVASAQDRVIEDLARSGQRFTAETVRARCAPLGSSPNTLGAALAAAARRGLITRVGFSQATRPEAHGRWIMEWQGTGGGGV